MKTQTIRIALILTLAVLLLGTVSFAASTGRLRVQVPFAFYASDQLLPAGNYWVDSMNNGRAIKVQRQDGPEFAIFMTVPTAATNKGGSYLLFNRYGAENFLRRIHSPEIALEGNLWKSHREKELAETMAKNSGDKRLAGPVQVTIQIKGE